MPRHSAPTAPSHSVVARLLSLLAAITLACASAVVFATEASACTCNSVSGQSDTQRADAIFLGTVLGTTNVSKPQPGRTEIRFEVSRVFKGSVYAQQVVASPLGSDGCGMRPEVNSSWTIFAEERVEGSGNDAVFRLVTQQCSGNQPGATAPVSLGRGRLPMDGISDREERAVSNDATFTRVLMTGGVVVGALVLMAGVGLAYLWRPSRRDI